MQRATRNTFFQKGGEVQKIDQHGVWAIIESSYLNPEYERICIHGETPEDEDTVISVARWVYRCRRLLRKKDHIIVILYNGEIFEPCYFIEPSTHTRFENGTLVWLEPLPQLNGYLLFPGGLPECEGSEYYYDYGSGSALGPSGIGSDYGSGSDIVSGYYGSDSGLVSGSGSATGIGSGSGVGSDSGLGSDYGYYGSVSVSGIDYGSGSGTSGISGTGGTGGTGIIDCSALLNCLCVQKDSQGRVTGVFIKNPDGSLTEIMDCGSGSGGSGGSGSGGCCPPDGSWYVLDYDLEILGDTISGTSDPKQWSDNSITWNYGITGIPDCAEGATFTCILGSLTGMYGLHCAWYQCALYTDDFDITVTGCPELPTFYITIKPGRCLSGSFVLRPA